MRECREELGVELPVDFLSKDKYEDGNGLHMFLSTYTAVYDDELSPNPDEVESVERFTMEQIQEMIEKGEPFHPELLFLLKKHYL